MNVLVTSLLSGVSGMSDGELRTINGLVIAELRSRQERKNALAKSALNVGDKVKFMSKYGLQVGVLTRFKQKNVEVMVGYTRWTVSPTLLSKVQTP